MLFYFQKIIRWIVFSNIWMALCAASLALQTFFAINAVPNFWFIVFVFSSTLSAYTLQRLLKPDKIKIKSARHHWIDQHHQTSYILLVLSVAASLSSLFFLPYKIIFFALPLGGISLFYAGNFLKVFKFSYENLRSLPGLKIFLIAASWSVLAGVLPAYISQNIYFADAGLVCAVIFLLIFALSIPFDIRDVTLDPKSQKTIPQVFGLRSAKKIAVVLLILVLIIGTVYFHFLIFFPLLIIVCLYTVLISTPNKPELFYTGLVDGLIMLFSLAVIADMLLINACQ